MEPVRLGVIGCGVMGPRHVADAKRSQLFDVVAVADIIEDRARETAQKHGVARWFRDGDELIQCDEVEAVVLALPTGVRTPLAKRALASGKHVLLEKPVAMNAREVRELLAIQGGLVAACCSSRFRTLLSARAIEQCIARGTLGPIRLVRGRAIGAAREAPSSPPPPWRQSRALNGGGILVNWGSYDLDYLLGITGWQLVPETVFAQTWPVAEDLRARVAPGSDADSHFIALVRCRGGAVLSLERGEFTSAEDEEACQVVGARASLRMRMTAHHGKIVTLDEADGGKGVVSSQLWTGDDDHSVMTLGVLTDFAQSIREGRRPATDLRRALVVQEITDAIYASAETGAEVRVADLSDS
jgi:predicted dehydrogenase